jgi:predicted ATPase
MHEHGFVQWLGRGMSGLGWVLVEQGSIEEGIAHIRQGLDVSISTGLELGRQDSLIMLAEAYGKAGRAAEGLHVLTDILTAAHPRGELYREAELYRLKGELLLQQALQTEAEACFHQAISVARHRCAKSFELQAVMSLCRLWQQQGKRTAARQMLAEIYDWFTEGFETSDLQEAKILRDVL